tara:strand:+ start:3563 stop:4585 length:1023 start_codon:yes stop_codon:yes gene_type:complete
LINIGIIGGGLIAKRHCEVLSDNPDCIAIALLSTGSLRSRALAEEFNCKFFVNSNAFFSEKLDAVIIASPNDTHAKYLKNCVDLKLPVLVEKPLFNKSDEDISLQYPNSEFLRTKILVGHHRHHFAKFQTLKKFINSGKLGDITSFQGSAVFYKPEGYFSEVPWRSEEGTGGPSLINLIHDVGLLNDLFGELRDIKCIRSNSNRKSKVEDTIVLVMKFHNGVLGNFIVSDCGASPWSWELTTGENNLYPQYTEDCYRIAGTKGSISFPSMKTHIYAGAPDWWKPLAIDKVRSENNDPFAQQLINFISMIRNNSLPLISYSTGLKNLKLVEVINDEKMSTN